MTPRFVVLTASTLLVLGVSLAVTTIDFIPQSWFPFAAGNLLAGLTYVAIGAIAGASIGAVGGAYFMFFAPMLDFGVAQNPMFFDGEPQAWATALPGYGSTRILIDGGFSGGFEATGPLVVGLIWLAFSVLGVVVILRAALGARA